MDPACLTPQGKEAGVLISVIPALAAKLTDLGRGGDRQTRGFPGLVSQKADRQAKVREASSLVQPGLSWLLGRLAGGDSGFQLLPLASRPPHPFLIRRPWGEVWDGMRLQSHQKAS